MPEPIKGQVMVTYLAEGNFGGTVQQQHVMEYVCCSISGLHPAREWVMANAEPLKMLEATLSVWNGEGWAVMEDIGKSLMRIWRRHHLAAQEVVDFPISEADLLRLCEAHDRAMTRRWEGGLGWSGRASAWPPLSFEDQTEHYQEQTQEVIKAVLAEWKAVQDEQ